MNVVDIVTKEYMRDNRVFADVCNYFLRRKVVKPEELKEYDSAEIFIPTILGESEDNAQKYRDVMKECTISMADDRVAYVLFGVENQTKIDHAMVLRTYIYDAMRYSKQLRDIAGMHEVKKDLRGAEYIARFGRDDRIKPIVTIVVYYGNEPWNAPLDLYGLFPDDYEDIYPMVDNYRIKVLEAAKLSDEEISGFDSSLRHVMTYIKYSKDGDKLREVVDADESFHHMETRAANVVNVITGSKMEIDQSKEEFDMCQAIQDITKKAQAEGAVAERIKNVTSLFKSGMTIEVIAAGLEITIEEVKAILEKSA